MKKFPLLLVLLLLLAGFSGCSATGLRQSSSSGVFPNLASFRQSRLRLPEKEEPLCLVIDAGAEYRLLQRRQFDLDRDGLPEHYTLRNGIITVQAGSRNLWRSPHDWWVDYFFLGDADNDGTPELNLLVWKEGSFGPYRPFWVEEDEPSVKNHLFIFRLEEGDFKAVWQSSNLDRPIYRAALVDLNGDGENELLVTEGSYTDPTKREITLWKWNGWGFSRLETEK